MTNAFLQIDNDQLWIMPLDPNSKIDRQVVTSVADIESYMKKHGFTQVAFSSTLDFPHDFTTNQSTLELVQSVIDWQK